MSKQAGAGPCHSHPCLHGCLLSAASNHRPLVPSLELHGMNLLLPTELPALKQSWGAARRLLFSGPHSPGTLHRRRGPAATSPWAQPLPRLSTLVTANPRRTAASGVPPTLPESRARLPCSVSPRTSGGHIQHHPSPPSPPRSMGQHRWLQRTAAPWARGSGTLPVLLPPPHPSPPLAAHPCPAPAVSPQHTSPGWLKPLPQALARAASRLRSQLPLGVRWASHTSLQNGTRDLRPLNLVLSATSSPNTAARVTLLKQK